MANTYIIIPLRGSILQAETCQSLSLAFGKYYHFVAPSCKLELARFSALLRIQDGAKCGKKFLGTEVALLPQMCHYTRLKSVLLKSYIDINENTLYIFTFSYIYN